VGGDAYSRRWELTPAEAGGAAAAGDVAAADPDRIERPEFANKVKPFERQQASIKGMMVSTLPTGQMIGFAGDIIMTTKTVGTARSRVRVIRRLGPDMLTALDESIRAVLVRYPHWDNRQLLEVSFEDKYSAKDGGSAGTAFALLMMSILEGFEIQPDLAVTGDIAVNWKVLKVGGVSAKIQGCRRRRASHAPIARRTSRRRWTRSKRCRRRSRAAGRRTCTATRRRRRSTRCSRRCPTTSRRGC